MRIAFLAAAFISVLSTATPATEYTSTGVGAGTCADFAQAMKDFPGEAQLLYMSWAQGYLTAINTLRMGNGLGAMPIFHADSGDQMYDNIWSRLRIYCDEHPLADFVDAILEATGSL